MSLLLPIEYTRHPSLVEFDLAASTSTPQINLGPIMMKNKRGFVKLIYKYTLDTHTKETQQLYIHTIPESPISLSRTKPFIGNTKRLGFIHIERSNMSEIWVW